VVADQLGHARMPMIQDVYMGRQVAHPAAASTLEGLATWDEADANRVVTVARRVGADGSATGR
jgi:hypothetical protein